MRACVTQNCPLEGALSRPHRLPGNLGSDKGFGSPYHGSLCTRLLGFPGPRFGGRHDTASDQISCFARGQAFIGAIGLLDHDASSSSASSMRHRPTICSSPHPVPRTTMAAHPKCAFIPNAPCIVSRVERPRDPTTTGHLPIPSAIRSWPGARTDSRRASARLQWP